MVDPDSRTRTYRRKCISVRRVVHFDTFCVSVGRLDAVEAVGVPYMPIPPLAERWNGSAWSIQGTVGYSGSFTAVSCSQIVCMAVGVDDSSEPQVERWDGQEWSSVIWAAEFFETTVSRTSRGFCAAMGVGPYLGARPGEVVDCTTAALGRPGRWSVEPLAGCLQLGADSVSCTSATGCTAALGGSAIYGWNGRRWMIERNALQSTEKLVSVSCVGPAACVGVGWRRAGHTRTILVKQWNGSRWSTVRVPTPPGSERSELGNVSCTSAVRSTCAGAGRPRRPQGATRGG